ncbi:hypothetical protein ACFLQU_01425 [Verrucomicrobiota bacterium]
MPLVYAFSDGAGSAAAVPLVEEVRDVLKGVDWCDVRVSEREHNMGLGGSIRAGVTDVLEDHDRIVVVEDDLILRDGAYDYTCRALDHYANDSTVASVSMWSHPSLVPTGSQVGFFANRPYCWGWGTYREYWEKYSGTPQEMYDACLQAGIDPLLWGKDIKWQVDRAVARNLWYVGFALTHILHEWLSYYPAESLAGNIGFDGTGGNCGNADWILEREKRNTEGTVDCPESWPEITLDDETKERFQAYFLPGRKSLFRKLLKWACVVRDRLVGPGGT